MNQAQESDRTTVRVAVIGVGNIGAAHAATISRGDVPGMTLAALCDISPEKQAYLRRTYPDVPIYASYEDLLASQVCDAVIVSTPHRFHPPICEAALGAGLHVLSEKPAGVDVATLESLYATAAFSNRVFSMMFNQRTDPLFAKAREIVQSGQLGVPKRLVWIITNWYRSQAYYDSGDWRATWCGEGGGVLLNQAPHNLDLWQWIFGMPKRLRAFCYCGKYHDISVEDDATLYAEYENGATATFITTTGEYPGTNRLEISGDRGKLVIENGTLRLIELSEPERTYCFNAVGRPAPTCTETVLTVGTPQSGHTLILQNFTNAILHGEPLLAPGTDGIYELTLSNAAYLSAATDDWVDIPFEPARFTALLTARQEDERAAGGDRRASVNQGATTLETAYKARWQVQW